jgi:DNA repair exonuclease SbcCD nuclease subunit/ABC-type Mn2+/Zn2+ transport system ATPase subunit/tetratricopeptide (TPR) repeat protein
MKIAHLADTHIRNFKFHKEYQIIFDQLYETLRKEKVDAIVHCGDIAHTKTQISPEFVEMCANFFESLASIAPTYIILGNHDGNLRNSNRQDALSPIVQALSLPNLHMLKHSGEVSLTPSVSLHVLSIFDRDRWASPKNKDKINVALYHGSISNCQTDMDWTMARGDDEIDIFKEYDFAMLGDIHRRQPLDKHGRIWYCGSTVQQNHGETDDKGLLIWDIRTKDDWDIKPIAYKNPKPFMSIELTSGGKFPKNLKVPDKARLRLISHNNLSFIAMKRAIDYAKLKFKPESIAFLNRSVGKDGSIGDDANNLQTENLRDVQVQEDLMKEYLKDYEVEKETLEEVFKLNQHFNKIVEENEEVARNINWKLKSFKWDNLFNYGDGNAVDFDRLGGIVGLFGKNFSGKSSVVDAILFTLFGTTTKNERKNLNVINQNKDVGRGVLEIEVGDKLYTIERTAEKYTKKLKGQETIEAKTILEFQVYDKVTGETTSLNGITRSQTDAKIRKHFGTIEDFAVSSLASQHGALAFIEEGSTKRKEIIAKFLDLEFLEKKFKLAKDESVDTRALLKKVEGREYEEEIQEEQVLLAEAKEESEKNKSLCDSLRKEIIDLRTKVNDVTREIEATPTEVIDHKKLTRDHKKKKTELAAFESKIKTQEAEILLKEERFTKSQKFLKMIDIDQTIKSREEIVEKKLEIGRLTEEVRRIEQKQKLLDSVPCGDGFPTCRFIRDAIVHVGNKKEVDTRMSSVMTELANLDEGEIEKQFSYYEKAQTLATALEREISSEKLSVEKKRSHVAHLQHVVKRLEEKINAYNENKEAIDNLENLLKRRGKYEVEIESKEGSIQECEKKTLVLYKRVGSAEQRVESIREQRDAHESLRREFSAFQLFMRCVHPNGIPYDIIKKKIPVINQEIAKVLANIVDFEIYFETEKNKLNIFIKHPKHEGRPIEMASGAEKTMAAMAIRLALLSVSSLPKSDFFVLDEPGTALDEENMEGFIRILELIKVYFKNVILISHLDSLKDCVDMQIVIDKKDSYARIKQ